MAKLDLKEVFHQIPVRPDDWHLLGFKWHKEFYYAVVLTSGMKSAPYIFNLFAEALHWIIERHIPAKLKHYLDDFLPIFSPTTPISVATDAVHWIQGLGKQLGLVFQDEKTVWPSTKVEYLGLTIDSAAMEASLPEDKLLYLRDLLDSWSRKHSCHLTEVQKLLGFLQFCSQVIPHSCVFLHRITQFSTTFKTPCSRRHIPAAVRSEIQWWKTYSSTWNGILLITQQFTYLPMLAVLRGLGAFSNLIGFHQRFRDDSAHGIFNSKKCMLYFKQSSAGVTSGLRNTLYSTLIIK